MCEAASSELFTIRVWTEKISETTYELRGKVLHVPTGECRYFREWSRLAAFVQQVMSQSGSVQGNSCEAQNDDVRQSGDAPANL